jgi:MFS family permease
MTTTGSESSPQTANQSHDVIAEIITDLILAQPDQIAQSPSHDGSTSAGSPGHRSRDRKRKCRKSQRRARFADFDVEKEASRSRDFDDTRGMTAAASKPPSPSLRASTAKGSEVDSAVSLHSTALPSISQDAHPHPSDTQPLAEQPPVAPTYPSPAKTALIMFSLYISIFLVALDRTIIGPAIPAITNQFHSLPDVGWYGSAYMLTSCGFILLYGRIYTFFPTKPVFLSGIALFEVGSAICGAANSSLVLIVGRAVAGLGSSGIFTGAILIMLNTVPLHKRPMLQGLFGACFGVASVTGPLLGGAFTGSKATWRWCFYINLPLGGLTIVVVSLLLRLEEQKPRLKTWRDLDPVGTMLFLPSITCLLLALEWGAADYAWSNPRIVALLTVFAVLFVAFAAWQYRTRDTTATVPARVLLQRSVVFGCAAQFCVGAAMLSVVLYVPIWFQAIQGVSAMQSGIRLVPLVLSVVVGSISSGALVQRIGYYTPFMIAGACLMAVGSGLITTWDMHTKRGAWIGFQVLFGLGVGWNM